MIYKYILLITETGLKTASIFPTKTVALIKSMFEQALFDLALESTLVDMLSICKHMKRNTICTTTLFL